MTPDEIEALATRVEKAIEAQRAKLQWFLFWLPLLFAVTYGLFSLFIAWLTHSPSSPSPYR